jgi:hypothetical protein
MVNKIYIGHFIINDGSSGSVISNLFGAKDPSKKDNVCKKKNLGKLGPSCCQKPSPRFIY